MSAELLLFIGLVVLLTLFQAAMAHPVRSSATMYQLMDRPSWLIGGVLAIGIAAWRPWFTTSWWKVLIAAPVLSLVMASVAQLFVERALSFSAEESPARRVAKAFSSLIALSLLFFGFRACG